MTKYAIIRVSTFDQKKKGLSVDVQLNRLKSIGIEEKNIFIDAGKSGGIKEDDLDISYDSKTGRFISVVDLKSSRPNLKRLMDILKDDDEIYITKFDRLSRDNAFQELLWRFLKRKNIIVKPLDEPSEPPLIRRMLGVIAMEELETVTSRNDKISKNLYDRNLYPYRTCFGYKKGKDSKLIIDEKQSEIVVNVFNDFIKNFTVDEISNKYDVNRGLIYAIIRNKTYLGMTHYLDEWKSSDAVPIIIDEETFNKANEMLPRKKSIFLK